MARALPHLLAAALLLGGIAAPPAARAEQQSPETEAEKRLLELNRPAPDFTLPLVGGGEVTLSNLLRFGKAVLVAFWAIEAKSGGADMAKLQKLHQQFETKGLATITINPENSAAEVTRFAESSGLQLQVAVDGKETNRAVTNRYRARMLPTLYLLDPDGRVLWRGIGFKEPGLRAAIEKAGIK